MPNGRYTHIVAGAGAVQCCRRLPAGRIDIVVVYKVDRLTRSLAAGEEDIQLVLCT